MFAHDARVGQAAQAHSAHICGEQHAERNSRGPDDQLEKLKPDVFVNERGAAAGREQDHQKPEHCRA